MRITFKTTYYYEIIKIWEMDNLTIPRKDDHIIFENHEYSVELVAWHSPSDITILLRKIY